MNNVTSANVDPAKRKELFADPPRVPNVHEISDRARHAAQRLILAVRRNQRQTLCKED